MMIPFNTNDTVSCGQYEAVETIPEVPVVETDDAGGTIPAVKTPTHMIEVIAPATLPAGYSFGVELQGKKFMAIVPKGGVEENHRFMVPVVSAAKRATTDGAPVGGWKDGLCDCFRYGICHPHLWLACYFSPIALAQVMTRERLNWLGSPGSVAEVAATFKGVVLIFIFF
jgi:hypothetical protein